MSHHTTNPATIEALAKYYAHPTFEEAQKIASEYEKEVNIQVQEIIQNMKDEK